MSTLQGDLAYRFLRRWLKTARTAYGQTGQVPNPDKGREAIEAFLDAVQQFPDAAAELENRAAFARNPVALADGYPELKAYVEAKRRGRAVLDAMTVYADGPLGYPDGVEGPPAFPELSAAHVVGSKLRAMPPEPSLRELKCERERLQSLLKEELPSDACTTLRRWYEESKRVACRGNRLGAEGCRWLADWSKLEALCGMAMFGDALEEIEQAAEALAVWTKDHEEPAGLRSNAADKLPPHPTELSPSTSAQPTEPVGLPAAGHGNAKEKRAIKWSHWAIGMGEKPEEWRLFHWFGDKHRWCDRGCAEIPAGRATKLATAMVERGGQISKSDAIILFCTGDRRNRSRKEVFDRVCKQARKDLAKAIREDVARITHTATGGNPIPWNNDSRGWIAAVQMGLAVRDDKGGLRFRHEEDMAEGFTESEPRPS